MPNQPMGFLIRARGNCDHCKCELGTYDTEQSAACYCDQCGDSMRLCGSCKSTLAHENCGGKFRNTHDDHPNLMH